MKILNIQRRLNTQDTFDNKNFNPLPTQLSQGINKLCPCKEIDKSNM